MALTNVALRPALSVSVGLPRVVTAVTVSLSWTWIKIVWPAL